MDNELRALLNELRTALAKLAARMDRLEQAAGSAVTVQAAKDRAAAPQPVAQESIAEETLLAISAAIAAYLGERVHIRQIRLISSPAWAQVGRASVQASHQVH